jgi:hypothetical protein
MSNSWQRRQIVELASERIFTLDFCVRHRQPAAARKKVSSAFDGRRITSDRGVMLLAQAERWPGIVDKLARVP